MSRQNRMLIVLLFALVGLPRSAKAYQCPDAHDCEHQAPEVVPALTGIYNRDVQPPLEDIPIRLTNYWFFDEHGNMYEGGGTWGNGCNSECNILANGMHFQPWMVNNVGACIQAWTKHKDNGRTIAVTLAGYGTLACFDRFGTYADPFFHETLQMWVIPVDWLSSEATATIIWDWSISWVDISIDGPTW